MMTSSGKDQEDKEGAELQQQGTFTQGNGGELFLGGDVPTKL